MQWYTVYRGDEPVATLEAGTPLLALAVTSLRLSEGRDAFNSIGPSEGLAAIATQLGEFTQEPGRISIGELWMPFDGDDPGAAPPSFTIGPG
jgi:hypothetical protein